MRILKKIIKHAFRPAINNIKGEIGEARVSKKLNPMLFGKVEHKQINNLTIVDENERSHQIDHVEIRQNGIFCIETKNYSGWIFGNESQSTWKQTLYKEKHYFPNPIKQNRSHIYHLNRVLGSKYKINSVIVMVQNNADRIDVPYVVNLRDLQAYISNFYDGTQYSSQEMESIYQTLLAADRCDLTKKEHLSNIQEMQRSIHNNICPRCGHELILRSGTYGKFYGCSNYPNCKFTNKI